MLLLLAVLAAAQDPDYCISGAGTPEVNGLYSECDDYTIYALNGTCGGLKGNTKVQLMHRARCLTE